MIVKPQIAAIIVGEKSIEGNRDPRDTLGQHSKNRWAKAKSKKQNGTN